MRVGTDVGALCRKCGDVWHVVVAVVDGRVAQVECKQCGARHRFRPPSGDSPLVRPAAKARRVSKAAHTPPRVGVVSPDLSRPVRRYDPSEHYQAGDRVVHPRFGEGVVQTVAGTTKVRILFTTGDQRTLVQARLTTG